MKAKTIQMGTRYWHRNCELNTWVGYVVPYCISYDCSGKVKARCWKISVGKDLLFDDAFVIDLYTLRHDYVLRKDDCTMLALMSALYKKGLS